MDKATLRECPFCGKTDKLNITHLSDNDMIADDWLIECEHCQFSQYAIYRTREKATTAWNTRPIEDKLKRDNKALLEALKDCMYEIRDRSDIKKKALEVIKKVEAGQ